MNQLQSRPGRLRALAWPLGAAAALSLAACVNTPPPKEQLAVSRAAVERISGPAASEAPVEVAAARDKLARAQRAMADKNYPLARQLAEQAEADAALAEARARASRSDSALNAVRESLRALRAELARS